MCVTVFPFFTYLHVTNMLRNTTRHKTLELKVDPPFPPARALLVPMLIGFRLSRRAHFHHDSHCRRVSK